MPNIQDLTKARTLRSESETVGNMETTWKKIKLHTNTDTNTHTKYTHTYTHKLSRFSRNTGSHCVTH